MKPHPILLEIFHHRFASIAEEMGMTLKRSSFSPNIKERQDFSCAIFNSSGEMIAQAAHIPVHLGSMPLSVVSAIENVVFQPGDMVILNDPFLGGTHLPDITIVAPVFSNKKLVFFVANRAHHADIGGISSGSMPLSENIFQEGLRIPPLKIIKKGFMNDDVLKIILHNVRTPYERSGDLTAQISANTLGITRIDELLQHYGEKQALDYATYLMERSATATRDFIASLPNGEFTFTDILDDDGFKNDNIPVHVSIIINDENLTVDFSQSHCQVKGCINAVKSITTSAVLYVIGSLIEEKIHLNAGCLLPINIITCPGTIVDATFPAAVAAGNVETSQRIVDVLLGALAQAVPDRIPAASQGTMNNLTIGGQLNDSNHAFAFYETIGGGMGAWAKHDGASAVQSHMTNTLNTPIEALEFNFPLKVTTYAIRKNSGGIGQFIGGDGIVREIQLLADAEVTVLSERRNHAPYGLCGGQNGRTGANILIHGGKKIDMPGKFHKKLQKNDIIRIETPGGGGYGTPKLDGIVKSPISALDCIL